MPSKDEEILEPVVEVQPEPTPAPNSKPELAIAVQEPAVVDNQTPYLPGQLLSFETGAGQSYSIMIEAIAGTDITFRNTQEGCAAITLPLNQAQEILETPARVH